MIMNAKLSQHELFGGYQRQGSTEISAPGALYADDF
jgi:hypothetical protein